MKTYSCILHNNVRYLFILSLTCICFTSQPQIKLKTLSINEGLNNSRVTSITQDSIGFMWFGTHAGMAKFDGCNFTHYSLEKPTTGQDNFISCIENTKAYDIICGTKEGDIYHYNRHLNVFNQLLTNISHPDFINITALKPASGNDFWIGSPNGLFYYDHLHLSVRKINAASFGINKIVISQSGDLWLATWNGLHLYDPKKDSLVQLNLPRNLDIRNITSIYLEDQSLLIGTANGTIFNLERKDNTLHVKSRNRFFFNNKNYRISDISSSPISAYAIAFDGAGVILCDSNLNKVHHLQISSDNDYSLSSAGVRQLYMSRDNIFWIATFGGGINFYNPDIKAFNVIRHVPYVNNSLRENSVNSIVEGNDGQVWYGTIKGVSIYNPPINQWLHIPSLENENDIPLHIMHMVADHANNIWVATYGNGLVKINQRSHEMEFITKNTKGSHKVGSNHLFYVAMDRQDRIWTGGIWGPLSVYTPANKQTTLLDIPAVRSIIEYEDQIIVGTLFGLYIVDSQTLNIKRPSQSLLKTARIITINRPPGSNSIYFGTELQGILKWNIEQDTICRLDENNGLSSNTIKSIVWDDNGIMWVSTSGGLTSYNEKTEQILNFSTIDGLVNNEFNQNACCQLKSGEIQIGSINGVSRFSPTEIKLSSQTVTPVLTGFKLFGEELVVEPNGLLNQNIEQLNELTLNYNQNSIGIVFSSIGYTAANKIKYKWKLDGYEDNWHISSTVKEANYSKLPSGNYSFHLQVTNDDGIWQEDVRTIKIKVKAPFWQTPLAYFIYLVILAGLILLLLHYYHTLMQDKHYAEKQQFFINIAHDLRTPLSLIKLPIEKLIQEEKGAFSETNQLALVKRNIDRLTRLVNQLLDFQKADLKKMRLQVDKFPFNAFIEQLLETFSPLLKEKNIHLQFRPHHEEIDLWFDAFKMEKILYNLISNAIKYNKPGGKITITTRLTPKRCYFSISDTGEGIPKKQQKNIFQHYFRATNAINSMETGSGLGLVLTKHLVKLHNGEISFKSSLGKGSTFSFYLPTGTKRYQSDEFAAPISTSPNTIITHDDRPIPINKSKKVKVLLIEDNQELLDTMVHELSSHYHIISAKNGQCGLDQAQKVIPDLIISDVMMPEMNGYQLCLKLKKDIATCHIPVILLTALSSSEYKNEGLEYGADAYLEKPFDMAVLLSQISSLLRNREMLKSKFFIPTAPIEDTAPTHKDSKFLEKIRNYIHKNLLSDQLSVENLAFQFNMSRPVLYRKIKAITNLSPQQLILNVRLKEAARLLLTEDRCIAEIIIMVGLTDTKYFSQVFKKQFGITPSEFIKKHK